MDKTTEELLKELEELRIVNSLLQSKILELEESQKDLKEIADRWQFALEGTDDGVWDWNAKTNIVFFSKKWKSMFGYEEHEIGNSLDEWDKRIYPEDKKKCQEDLEKHFNKETPIYKNEHRVLCKDGSYKWILDRGKVVEWDEEGKPLRVVGTHVDITSRKQIGLALQESELKFRTVADFTYDWEYWINETEKIVYISPSCERITRYLPEDFLNDPTLLNTIIHPEDFALMENHLRKFHTLAGRNETEEFDFRITRKDSSIIHINHVCRPVFDQNNKYIGRRASNRDITERKLMEEKIQQQNKELVDANASKDKFFSIIAHDLKGPFSGFLGLTAMMQEPDINLEEMRQIGSMLNTSANNVYRLLENLLTWARIQRGAIEFNPVVHNLSSTAMQSINILSETAKQKEIDIIESIPKHLEAFADSSMLDTIFRNLITNSIKFTKRGGKITVSAKENDIEIIIQVQDTGIGMNEKILEGLFKMDQKIARPGTERETSTGLGLLLCKEFVELHKGKIWATSEVDKGSSFYFTLTKKISGTTN
jgi:PAS domain S-box-containing protein